MTILLAAAFAFIAAFALAVLVAALSPAKAEPVARKLEPTYYVGPTYTAHGREVIRPTSKLRAL